MRSFAAFAAGVLFLQHGSAAPAPLTSPEPTAAPSLDNLEERDLLSDVLSDISDLVSDVTSDTSAILSALEKVTATTTPTAISQVQASMSSIYSTTPTNIYENVATQIAEGLCPTDISTVVSGYDVGENSVSNSNPEPSSTIYPQASSADAPYSLEETALRQAIYIPSGFGEKSTNPILMVPGTGSYGGINFASNLRKLLEDTYDTAWLNVPGAMLDDAQINSEYVAYAINYISSITSKNISVISWSQGGLDTQWAFTFWPSTREVVSDFLPVSPDFHGTVLANVLCLSADSVIGLDPCDPSVIQQEYTSNYVEALRSHGGGSAYVPTTTFYSGLFDEIVEPQQGTAASAYLEGDSSLVTNNEAQLICPDQPAGGFYGHAGMLYNPITYALIVDALTHDGPGLTSRIDLTTVCQEYAAPGLGLDDVLATESLIPIAAVLLLVYTPKLVTEPALMSYASS